MHTGMLASWSGLIVLYELITFDPTDRSLNPCWRQGSYVIPFISRIGAISSLYSWSLGIKLNYSIWTYETIALSHLDLALALILASFWHWAYSDLNVFAHRSTRLLVLDLNKILGIHFILASVLCFGFGYHHLSGFIGPGMWTSDSKGLEGCIRFVKPIYSLISTSPKCYALIPSHHIASGFTYCFVAYPKQP